MRPAGGFAQPFADIGFFALHQKNLAIGAGDFRFDAGHTAARMIVEIDAPFFGEDGFIQRAGRAVMRDGVGHIEADAACAHNGDPFADRLIAFQHIDIADRFFMGDALNIGHAGADAGGHNHMLKIAQHIGFGAGVQLQLNAQLLNHFAVIAQRLVKLFLARHQLGEVELPANLVGGIKQRHLMAALGGDGGIGQTGRTGANHRDGLRRLRRLICQQGFMTGARIDQTACRLAAKCMVEAGLIAGDAGVNLIGAVFGGFGHKLAVGQHGARH